jgi:hypothetical protein
VAAQPTGAAPEQGGEKSSSAAIDAAKEPSSRRISLKARVASRKAVREAAKVTKAAVKAARKAAKVTKAAMKAARRAGGLTPSSSGAVIASVPLQRRAWRSERAVAVRMTLAWLFNVFTYVVFALSALIYGVKFGDTSTNEMLTVWMVAMFQVYVIVEPVQIFFIVLATCLFDGRTPLGRFCLGVRICYNDFFSP